MKGVVIAGEVYTWGDNDEGQLGDGSTSAIQKPRLVAALQGFCHIFLVARYGVFLSLLRDDRVFRLNHRHVISLESAVLYFNVITRGCLFYTHLIVFIDSCNYSTCLHIWSFILHCFEIVTLPLVAV